MRIVMMAIRRRRSEKLNQAATARTVADTLEASRAARGVGPETVQLFALGKLDRSTAALEVGGAFILRVGQAEESHQNEQTRVEWSLLKITHCGFVVIKWLQWHVGGGAMERLMKRSDEQASRPHGVDVLLVASHYPEHLFDCDVNHVYIKC